MTKTNTTAPTTENKKFLNTTFFVTILYRNSETGKMNYDLVYRTKDRSAAYHFASENFIREVTTSVKTGAELVKLGVSEKTLKSFKNPDIY